MGLTSGGRRAQLFAELLESRVGTDDPVVSPFLALAGALQAVPAASGPRPEFRDALRQRLVAVATVQGVGSAAAAPSARLREASATWKFQRRVAIVAGGAAAATAIAGVGVGASRSLPGDPFYGVKRTSEDVQLATTFGTEAKGKRHLEFARTRLSEVEALVGRSSALSDFMPGAAGALGPLTDEAKSSTIISTLRDMDAETRAGADDLMTAYRSSGSTEPLHALDNFTQKQYSQLRDLVPALPTQARPRAQLSLSLLDVVATRTVRLATGGTTGPQQTGHPGVSRTPAPTKTPDPTRTGSQEPSSGQGGSNGTGDGSGSQSSPAPGTSGVPLLPTTPPTIPSLPTTLPLPTKLPTAVPTLPLPSLPDLPLLGG